MKKFGMFENRLEAEIAEARKGLTRNGYGKPLERQSIRIQNTKREVPMAAQSKA